MNFVSEEHLVLEGRALSHAVSHDLNADAQCSSHGSPCANFSWTGPSSSSCYSIFPLSVIIPSVLHICSSVAWWMHKAPIRGHSFTASQELINCVEETKKLPHYRLGQALGAPGGCGSQNF
jgi:hypothetical protein